MRMRSAAPTAFAVARRGESARAVPASPAPMKRLRFQGLLGAKGASCRVGRDYPTRRGGVNRGGIIGEAVQQAGTPGPHVAGTTGSEERMRWEGRAESENVEDRRGLRIPGGGAGIGCGGLLVVLVISLLTGADPRQILGIIGLVQQAAPQATQERVPDNRPPADDPQTRFMRVILKD